MLFLLAENMRLPKLRAPARPAKLFNVPDNAPVLTIKPALKHLRNHVFYGHYSTPFDKCQYIFLHFFTIIYILLQAKAEKPAIA